MKIRWRLKPNAAYFKRMNDAALAVADAALAEYVAKGRELNGEVSHAAFEKAKRVRRDAVARYALLSVGVDPDMNGNEITWWARHVLYFHGGRAVSDFVKRCKRKAR